MASPRRIELDFNLIPPFYREAVYAAGRGPAIGRYPEWTPQLALELMDAHGIEVALTSLAQPGVGFVGGAGAQELARRCNDYAAELIARWPKRFGAFGTVPMWKHGGRARCHHVFARYAQVRRRLPVCELRREFSRRRAVRSAAGSARRAQRGRVRPPRPASLEWFARAALARLHDGGPVRHHARGGEPRLLPCDRTLPAHSLHPAARRRARALFRLAAFGLADDRPAPAAAVAR